MKKTDMSLLLCRAREEKKRAYSPYSGFSVGAALLCDGGEIYEGCNIENSAFSPTCCAERVALFSAVADGKRSFSAIAIAGDKAPCMPCGVCRQVLSEFSDGDLEIIYESESGEAESTTLSELLPRTFRFGGKDE